MATTVDGQVGARAVQRGFMADQGFFTRFTIVLAVLILFGFAQFAARGFVDVRAVPLLTHLHAAIMVCWLGLAVAQNVLVHRNELVIHRKLGWVAGALVAAILVTGPTVGYSAVAAHRVPPFFTDSYFMALTLIEPIAFAGLVAWGVSLRRKTQWHRRAMLGANVIILEPAFGRLLPMPLMGGWGEWVILVLQLGTLAVLARHDRKVLGSVHPATLMVMGVVAANHVIISALSKVPLVAAFAQAVAGG